MPPRTPLLRSGDYRYALNLIDGTVGRGERAFSAKLMHLSCVDVDSGHDDSSETTHRYTVMVRSAADPGKKRLGVMVCSPRTPIPGVDAYEAWRKKLRRLDLESSEFERRFELAIDRKADAVWARRLFEPTFIEKMTLLDPGRIGWEVEAGSLAVYEAGHHSLAGDLDRLTALAALVVERVADEVAESKNGEP